MSSFIEQNKKEIETLCESCAKNLKNLDLSDTKLSIPKCVEIVGEFHKMIHSNLNIVNALDKLEDSNKTGCVLELTLHILSSANVMNVLNENQRNTLKDFCNKSENVQIISKLVNWVAGHIFEKIDPNKDGTLTKDELTDCCVKCCTCCPNVGKKIGSCWAWLCINVCCCNCGDDKIEYKK